MELNNNVCVNDVCVDRHQHKFTNPKYFEQEQKTKHNRMNTHVLVLYSICVLLLCWGYLQVDELYLLLPCDDHIDDDSWSVD